MRSEVDRAIQIHSPTLNAASAARQPSQMVSCRSSGLPDVRRKRKVTVTMMQRMTLGRQPKAERRAAQLARRATIGPTPEARRAGMYPAGDATAISSSPSARPIS